MRWGSSSEALWCGRSVEPLHSAESSARRKLPILNRGVDNSSARPQCWLFSLISLLLPYCFLFARCVIIACIVHPRDHSVARDARGWDSHVHTRRMAAYPHRKRASAETNPQRTSSPRPLLLSSTPAATSTAFRSVDYLSFPPSRLQPSSRRIASRSIFHTLRTWRAPRGPVILMVSRMLLFIQCRVREALAGSFAGLRDTRQKSHENHFNSRRASTYPAGDKARERIIADECFREWQIFSSYSSASVRPLGKRDELTRSREFRFAEWTTATRSQSRVGYFTLVLLIALVSLVTDR